MYISIFLKSSALALLLILQANIFANEKEDKVITNNNEFKGTIRNNKYCFIYAYNGDLVNKNNQSLYNDYLETQKLLNSYFKGGCKISRKKIVRAFEIDYSMEQMKEFARNYDLEGTSYIMCFTKGSLSYSAALDGYLEDDELDDILYEAFSKKKYYKKRWSRERGSYDEDDREARKVEKVYVVKEDSYSEPRVGINFGVGVPYWDWPGYSYGRPWGFGPWGGGGSWRHHRRGPRPYFGVGFGVG
jgi:hypothetical protein